MYASIGIPAYRANLGETGIFFYFYGPQMVVGLLPPQIESETIIDNGAWEIPCVEIKEEPAYG